MLTYMYEYGCMNVFTLEVLTIASFSNIPERCSGALCNQISLAILNLRPTSQLTEGDEKAPGKVKASECNYTATWAVRNRTLC